MKPLKEQFKFVIYPQPNNSYLLYNYMDSLYRISGMLLEPQVKALVPQAYVFCRNMHLPPLIKVLRTFKIV